MQATSARPLSHLSHPLFPRGLEADGRGAHADAARLRLQRLPQLRTGSLRIRGAGAAIGAMAGAVAVGATVVVAFERCPPVAVPEMVSPVEPTTARTPLADPPVIGAHPGFDASAAYRTKT